MDDHGNKSNPADEVIDLALGLSYRTYTSSGDRDDSNDYIIEMTADYTELVSKNSKVRSSRGFRTRRRGMTFCMFKV